MTTKRLQQITDDLFAKRQWLSAESRYLLCCDLLKEIERLRNALRRIRDGPVSLQAKPPDTVLILQSIAEEALDDQIRFTSDALQVSRRGGETPEVTR